MKALVLWSSRTGNTKAVGEAIYDALPCDQETSSLPSTERKSLSTARQAPIPTLLRQ